MRRRGVDSHPRIHPRSSSVGCLTNQRATTAMPADTILSVELIEALRRIGSQLEASTGSPDDLETALHLLNTLPADAVVRAEREIVHCAKLYHYWQRPNARSTVLHQLKRSPGLQYLFVFHGDGTIREAALRKMVSGLPSPFLFAAIAWRLNDWGPPVWRAAAECARRVFPLTAAPVIADAALALLSRENSWRRWTDERAILIETLGRSDVAPSFIDLIRRRQTGAVASVLRRALQQESFDFYLQQLAQEAAQPAVRAVALQALLEGFANWPSGFERQWVDKSMGITRRVKVFDRRPLSPMVMQTQPMLRRQLILSAVADRSAIVRKVALDGLIRCRDEIPDAKEIAAPLILDRAASVRDRARFLLRTGAEIL